MATLLFSIIFLLKLPLNLEGGIFNYFLGGLLPRPPPLGLPVVLGPLGGLGLPFGILLSSFLSKCQILTKKKNNLSIHILFIVKKHLRIEE
ncbi:hypothetical protein [Campylobacter upsaliensis]|uniref:hypothetical protein n=1 Tax=Campylobacter upsaliensis TaxID=28080 RepID=UPI0022EB431C|nr:hypothetical protein [Campylobacter upsaliensis]